jgi:hypothetical protein
MSGYARTHAAATPAGLLTLITWALYIISIAVLYYPNFLASLLLAAFFGLVACAAVAVNFRYWRAAVLLSSVVYFGVYATRVIRMTGMTTTDTSFMSAVSSYYRILWQVTMGMFQERGTIGGLAQVFVEYVMPVLAIVLILLVLASRRQRSGAFGR